MESSQIPDWISRRSAQQQESAILWIKGTGGAQFWGCLFRKLEKNVQCLPKIGANGRVSNLTTIADEEQRYRLETGRRGRLASISYTDIFYVPAKAAITCRTLEGDLSVFRLCPLPEGGIGVIPEDEFIRMDACLLAERLVAEAVDRMGEP